MHKIKNTLTILMLFIACQPASEPEPAVKFAEERAKINRTLNAWHRAAAQANYKEYMNYLAPGATFVGTDVDEVWSKGQFAKFCKPHFKKGRTWDFETINRNLHLHDQGKVAWFNESLNTWMGVCRGSGTLLKQSDSAQWKIVQYVLSVTAPNENIGAVLEAKQQHDSLYLAERNFTRKSRSIK